LADIEEACTLRKCFFQGNHSLNTKEQTNELNKMYSLNEREKTEYVEIVIHVLFPLQQITMSTIHDAITPLTLRKSPRLRSH